MYGVTVRLINRLSQKTMFNTTSVNKFRDNLKNYVDEVINNHTPLKVTRRNGEDFVVMSVEDWETEQETLYVLQNSSLMEQIADSQVTHHKNKGYQPNQKQIDEIFDI